MNAKKQPINERFRGYLPVIVDIETAGFNPKKNPLLEIAAIVVEYNEDMQLTDYRKPFKSHHSF